MTFGEIKGIWIALALALVHAGALNAAPPPDRLNYQGVLRDAADAPLDGDFDMVFRFWSAESAGDEILLDRHLAANFQAVTVSGGLFSAALGSGELLDGAGPGSYGAPSEVFRDYGDVWLEVQVGSETLTPRIAVSAAGYALNSAHLDGRSADEFLDTSSSEQTKLGHLIVDASGLQTYGITATGDSGGGFFTSADGTAQTTLAADNYGILATGSDGGGAFVRSDLSGQAYLAEDGRGVTAYGTEAGGYFFDLGNSGEAYVGYGNIGIEAYGSAQGGYFKDSNGSGTAIVGNGDQGIRAFGYSMGGFFEDSNNSGFAYVGYGEYGVFAYGNSAGGYFQDLNSTAYSYVGIDSHGIHAYGSTAGGYFNDTNSGTSSRIAYGASSTWGTGAKNFVQNHPDDPARKIVYTSLEGNEAGTYSRGSARLEDGVARIALDETFAWVTNPDLGLTAQLTPRDDCRGLRVVSLTTEELVVQELADGRSDAAFDWVVIGLRIGFEEIPTVQPKSEAESLPIPSMAEHRELLEQQPELEAFTPLDRFRTMETQVFPGRHSDGVDLSRARALVAAIHEFDPATDAVPQPPAPEPLPEEPTEAAVAASPAEPMASAGATSPEDRTVLAEQRPLPHDPASEVLPPSGAVLLPFFGTIEAGDLLAFDQDYPGVLRVATTMADPAVVGVAALSSTPGNERTGEAVVHCLGPATAKVDAGYGAIRAGDLLSSSATAGHAMLAPAAPPAGTIVGKALEPLGFGTGTIRVLLMAR